MKKLLMLTPSLFLVACLGQNDSAQSTVEEATSQQISSKTAPKLYVELSEKRSNDVQSVVVNIKQIEVLFSKKEQDVRYLLGTQLGQVDLLEASQGIALELSQFSLPAGAHIKHIRILLEETGHYLVKTDGSQCLLKTPSAQQSGLKINSLQRHQFEAGKDYVLSLNFDTSKGLVFQGNGNCLLKPVLRLGGLVAYAPEVVDPVVVIPEDDGSGDDIPSEDPETETPGGSVDPTAPTDPGSVPTVPDDTTGDDEWDYTPIVDGVPTIIP